MKSLSLSKKDYIINGIVFILIGLLIVAFPEGVLKGISLYVGLVILIPGIIMLIAGFMNKSGSGSKKVLIWEGVFAILFGLLFILMPELIGKLFSVFISIWVIFNGIFKMSSSFALKGMNDSSWWVQLLIGLVLLAFGIYVLINAFGVSTFLAMWVGVFLLIFGVYYLWEAFTGKIAD